MTRIADLHIHSRFSRATSRDLTFVALHRGALEKGISLLGTGDFTHPGWMADIEEQLMPAEEGLLKLKPDYERAATAGLPPACRGIVRFVLQVEISNIYKQEDRTRKNHHLIFAPSLEAGRGFADRLDRIGNIRSDGRPILGLSARDLLEITLETDPLCFLIPAHIWTPWFSVLGSKSGFDSIEACYGDLSGHIFAVETGLSSDPAMNWRLSALDGMTLISNSDAHSVSKLGREANLLDIDMGYVPLLRALRYREGYKGTLEFYPDEGKYHLDGHRNCNVRMTPDETRAHGGCCPVCKRPVTVGVLNRVEELSDRPEGYVPKDAAEYESIVPLAEVVSAVTGTAPGTKKVRQVLQRLSEAVGPELHVLRRAPLEDIEAAAGSVLKEAIHRVRTGQLIIDGGYDGEFGTIRIFAPRERDWLGGQMHFLAQCPDIPREETIREKRERYRKTDIPTECMFSRLEKQRESRTERQVVLAPVLTDVLLGLDADQRKAAAVTSGPLLVKAGPGTGKTRTLVARIANLIVRHDIPASRILAISFTNQAAVEIAERLEAVLDPQFGLPKVTTFHALGKDLLQEFADAGSVAVASEEEREERIREILGHAASGDEVRRVLSRISLAKQHLQPEIFLAEDRDLLDRYTQALTQSGRIDVDDLVLSAVRMLCGDPELTTFISRRWPHVLVDEYQDVNDLQAEWIRLLSERGESLMVIGDPDQAIYGFRGARPGHFHRFEQTFASALTVELRTTYRLTDHILRASRQVLGRDSSMVCRRIGVKVELMECPTAASEAEQIVVRIERLLGGTSSFARQSGRTTGNEEGSFGFSDMAVLVRTRAQRAEILAALTRSAIPCLAVGEEDRHDPRSQKVAVMTMHAAKGREFDVVFVAGVEPGLLPLQVGHLQGDEEEERRLLYVAMTRARTLCVISCAAHRTLFGVNLPGGRSPFIEQISTSSLTFHKPDLPQPRPSTSQLSLL